MIKWFEKFKEQPSNISEYTDLAPVDEIENGDEYLNALKWAIDNEKVKNIALAGPYGSGKSSIIESYLKNNSNKKQKSLKISMATFVEYKNDKDGTPKLIDIPSEEIEIGILKQLFYKVPYKKIPQSRYRKLHRVNWLAIWGYLLLFVIICSVFVYVFFSETFHELQKSITVAGEGFGISSLWSYMIFAKIVVLLTAILAKVWRYVFFKFKVKEVRLPTNTVINDTLDDKDTVFNKNLDEIIYFFEETRYNVIFFEDLDRLNQPSIFIHLRELNNLLNNYDAIKKPIVFIYAVKDDIFRDNDRTKFFDFIIPVVPIINSTNSGEILVEKLDKAESNNIIHHLPKEFLLDISPYISDMRILQNLYNEFLIYKKTLTTNQQLKLTDRFMMALVVFKNLYPRDFADIQNEKGIIKQAFDDKDNFVKNQCPRWEKEITLLTQSITQHEKDAIKNAQEIKLVFLSAITGWKGIATHISSYRADDIMEETFDFSVLSSFRDNNIYYRELGSGSSQNIPVKNFQEIFNSFNERYKSVKRIEEKGILTIQQDIESLQKKIQTFKNKSLKDILDEFEPSEVFSENVLGNKLLVFLLRRGYINEEYANHINYFKGNTITKDDMNFILSIKNREKLTFDYTLTKTEMIITRLQDYEFEQKEIYNFILLDCLLSNDVFASKLIVLIKQLSDGSDASWQFINQFFDRIIHDGKETKNKAKFIYLLSKTWNKMWDYIYENTTLTYDKKVFYLSLILSEADIENIIIMNSEQNSIVDFVTENADVLKQLSIVPNEKICIIVHSLNIKFINIDIAGVADEVINYIFEQSCYELNLEMIETLIQFKNIKLHYNINTQNYTAICKSDYEPLINYMHEEISQYINNIVLADANVKESIDSIVSLITRVIDDTDLGLKIIRHQDLIFENITDCCGELMDANKSQVNLLWDELLKEDKIVLNWGNVITYWAYYDLGEVLISYIEKHSIELNQTDMSAITPDFIKSFIVCNVDDKVLFNLLPCMPLDEFAMEFNTISERRLEFMIEIKYFNFSVTRYNKLQTVYPSLKVPFILSYENEFMQVHNEIIINDELLEKLLPLLTIENSQKLFEVHGIKFLTSAIADIVVNNKLVLNKNQFDEVWKKMSNEKKELLMMQNLQLLNDNDLYICFTELGDEYSEFLDRSSRHEVRILDNDKNRRLADRLIEVNYISNYLPVKEHDIDQQRIIKLLSCKIKAKS